MTLLGIDIGTTGCKAAIFSYEGEMIAYAYHEYPLVIPQAGWMELDPNVVADYVFMCISECSDIANTEKLVGISISSQGEAVVPVGLHGEVLSNSILTFDSRCFLETEWLLGEFGRDYFYENTGAPISSMFTLPKLLWIRKNQPEVFINTWKFMCFGDFIAYRLGANPCIDFSMASRTLLFDLKRKEWSDEIFSRSGLERKILSEAVESTNLIGYVSSRVSKELNLPEKTPIFAGAHDQVCCALGCGLIGSGQAMDSLGTTESILTVKKECSINDAMKENNFPCYVYPVNDLYAYFSFLSSSGSILRWFRNNLIHSTEPYSFEELNTETQEKYKNPTGIFVLPHFSGSGTPYLNDKSKGIIAGLSLDSDYLSLYKAILEGTCYESRLNIELMENAEIEINQLRCIGGGAKSDFWMQIKSNITQKEIVVPAITEAGCAGAAILAGIGAGIYSDANEAQNIFVKSKRTYHPQPGQQSLYEELYQRYKTLYKNNEKLFT